MLRQRETERERGRERHFKTNDTTEGGGRRASVCQNVPGHRSPGRPPGKIIKNANVWKKKR